MSLAVAFSAVFAEEALLIASLPWEVLVAFCPCSSEWPLCDTGLGLAEGPLSIWSQVPKPSHEVFWNPDSVVELLLEHLNKLMSCTPEGQMGATELQHDPPLAKTSEYSGNQDTS